MPIMPPMQPGAGGPEGLPPEEAEGGAPPPPPEAGPVTPGGGPSRDEGEMDEKQLDSFMDKALQVIYGGKTEDGKVNDAVADMLRRHDDPTQALADTAARVSSRIHAGAQEANFSLDPAVVFAATMQIVEELATMAGEEGIYDYGQDEVNAAATRAGESLYAMTEDQGGVFSQEEAMSDAGDLTKASQSGEMDQAIKQLEGGAGQPAPQGGGPIMGMAQ